MSLERTIDEMKLVFKDMPHGIEHTNRVLRNAEFIMNGESISGMLREIISLAAVLHDIGAIEAQKKHGTMEGYFQEIEGLPIAQSILERAGVSLTISKRVCYIVSNHHTPSRIDGVDFQILWEADYVEYLLSTGTIKDPDALNRIIRDNFRTATGRGLAYERLGVSG